MLEIEKRNTTSVIYLNNPPINILSVELLVLLNSKIIESIEAGTKTVIITGRENIFGGGGDLKHMESLSPEEAVTYSETAKSELSVLENHSIPTIAAVNGHALGGGLELAMSCDIILASSNAIFGQPEVKYGIIPGWGGTQRLPRRIGISRAKDMIFTGAPITADKAYEIGLVTAVFPSEKLIEEALEIGDKIGQNSLFAISQAKKAIEKGSGTTLSNGFDVETACFKEVFSNEDRNEGIRAFFQKRKPRFK